MDRLDQARRALVTLEAVLTEPPSLLVRDAAIQRFEYTSEATWKAAQAWLKNFHLISEGSARATYRRLFQLALIPTDLATQLQEVVEDRNRTVHTYIEAIAAEVFLRIPRHTSALRQLLEILEANS